MEELEGWNSWKGGMAEHGQNRPSRSLHIFPHSIIPLFPLPTIRRFITHPAQARGPSGSRRMQAEDFFFGL
jgi:hypothetical protein